MHDIAIIGGGPAGLSAAITARARNKDVVVISNPAQENPLAKAKMLDNYPGMPQASGLDILTIMHSQAHELGAGFVQAKVITVLPTAANFCVTTSNDILEARSLIIACGAASGGKPFPGEMEYLGRGGSYCATGDGRLYRDAEVLVVGLSPEAPEEADFLAELGAIVHYVATELPPDLDRRIFRYRGRLLRIEGDALGVTHCLISELPGGLADATSQGAGASRGAVEAAGVLDEDEAATQTKAKGESNQREIQCGGVFLLRPGIAPASLLPGLRLQNSYIEVNAQTQTNIPGVFAAGDCTGKPLQVAKAVGQGQLAAFAAVDYLAR